jgi:glycosyltransferase involved in cell wall biosynthesis
MDSTAEQMTYVYDVSVLVTAYNQNSTLAIVLKALQQQDFDGTWEIIVCDDGSDQDTLSAIKHATLETGPPMRYVWQPRQGERRARSRNNALRCASGRIVILVDGDIAVKRDFISAHAALHTGGRTAVCGSRYWLFLGDLPEGSRNDLVVESLLLEDVDLSSLYSEIWFQQQYADSAQPWAACWGCNFSFARDGCVVLFDEEFIGWGAEDQEFACRLHELYHYNLQFVPSLFGFHLDQGTRNASRLVRTRSQAEITSFIRNLLHFCNLYPMLDMVPACIGIGHFELDPDLDIWRPARRPRSESSHIRLLLAVAREWIARADQARSNCVTTRSAAAVR